MKTWGLPFPFLITHILRKTGIRGTLANEPITKSPYFGPIQWRQSLSHMPRAALEPTPQLQPEPEPALEPEPMDIPEMVAEHEMAFEPQREAEQEEQPEEYEEEYEDEECITLRRSDLLHFQDTLVDIQSQITDVRL
jgi:hypothetical protein